MLLSQNAFIFLHDTVLLVGSCSGPGAAVQDDWTQPVLKQTYADMSDADIGKAVRAAWARCRYIRQDEMAKYKDMLAAHMALMGAATEKALYKKTKSTSAHLKNGIITMTATKQKGFSGFEYLNAEITLPETASDTEIGHAVKEILSQCISKY
jgi:hypothetical protein